MALYSRLTTGLIYSVEGYRDASQALTEASILADATICAAGSSTHATGFWSLYVCFFCFDICNEHVLLMSSVQYLVSPSFAQCRTHVPLQR